MEEIMEDCGIRFEVAGAVCAGSDSLHAVVACTRAIGDAVCVIGRAYAHLCRGGVHPPAGAPGGRQAR